MFAGFYSLKFLGKIVYKCIANVTISGILYKNQHCNIYTGDVKSSRQEFIAFYLILLGAVPRASACKRFVTNLYLQPTVLGLCVSTLYDSGRLCPLWLFVLPHFPFSVPV